MPKFPTTDTIARHTEAYEQDLAEFNEPRNLDEVVIQLGRKTTAIFNAGIQKADTSVTFDLAGLTDFSFDPKSLNTPRDWDKFRQNLKAKLLPKLEQSIDYSLVAWALFNIYTLGGKRGEVQISSRLKA
jgi:hypothetical protein